ncbi:MAG: exosortase system-associated protein, TIGR04073 family [Candidatus Omnitrophota bacterium]|nr:exosortase system-associated protein, TIGR04073 family [Candidatus Omnitrophota bacterium]
MRNVFLTIFVVAVILPIVIVYSQPAQKPNISASSVSTVDAYRSAPLKAHQESLQSFNAGNEIYKNDSPVTKMSTGIVNATTSWVDVPAKISEESGKSNPLVGWTLGFGEGLVTGVARTGAGIIDIVTFALPPYDEPLIEPEHKVEKPDEGFKIDILKW